MNPGDEISRRSGRLPDPWTRLRLLTAARIALGRTGGSVPTKAMLDFQLAHAAARDAVHAVFEPERLGSELSHLTSQISNLQLIVESDAPDARRFLLRPDLGRRLNEQSREMLCEIVRTGFASTVGPPPDLVFIISDGLSALAVHRQVVPLMRELLPLLARPPRGAAATGSQSPTTAVTNVSDTEWNPGPIVIATRGRVAIEDEIGEILGAQIAVILIGERPGLGSPDSLGAYLVYGPRVGNTDANRNCVSNIRPEGLGYAAAARTIHYLLTQARRHRLTGVGLKDNSQLLSEPAGPGVTLPP